MKFMKIVCIGMLALAINSPMHGMWNYVRAYASAAATKTAAYIRMQTPKVARVVKQTLKTPGPYCAVAFSAPIVFKKNIVHAQESNVQGLNTEYINNFTPKFKEKSIEIAKEYMLKTDEVSVRFICDLIHGSQNIAIALTPYASAQLHRTHPDILQAILLHNPNAAAAFAQYFAVLNCNEETQEKQKTVLLGLLDNYLQKRTPKKQRNPMHLLLTHQNLNWEFSMGNRTISFDEYLFDAFTKKPNIISYGFHGAIIDHCSKIHHETATKFLNITRASYARVPQDGIVFPFNPKIHLQRTRDTAQNNLGSHCINAGHYHHTYIVFSQNEVAGYVILNLDRNYVAYLFVDSNKRKKHYGQRLMEQAIMHFRQNETGTEFKEITLYSLADEAPRSLYEKLGFKAPDRTNYKLT